MNVAVVFTDVFPEALHPQIAAVAPTGWSYRVATDPSPEGMLRLTREADVIFSGATGTTDEILCAARRLTFVQKLGAGVDSINLELCRQRGIGVANLPGNNAVAAAEHAVMLMLAVYRHLAELDRVVRSGGWVGEERRAVHRELRGKTVGLVGFGNIGRAVAKRVRAFEADVIYHDLQPGADEATAVRVTLPELLERSDIVSLHLPLLPETTGIVDRRWLASMKPGSVLINCARGGLVNEADLVDALTSGRLYGAGLDCFAGEYAGGSAGLWSAPNLVLSPHVAGASVENFETMLSRAFGNARSYLAGEPLSHGGAIVDPVPRRLDLIGRR